MSGYIIMQINSSEAWNGTSWTDVKYTRYIKVFPTKLGAQREVNQLNEERPGMAGYLVVVEA